MEGRAGFKVKLKRLRPKYNFAMRTYSSLNGRGEKVTSGSYDVDHSSLAIHADGWRLNRIESKFSHVRIF